MMKTYCVVCVNEKKIEVPKNSMAFAFTLCEEHKEKDLDKEVEIFFKS